MANREELLKTAKALSKSFPMKSALKLAESYGWVKRKSSGGSHMVYTNKDVHHTTYRSLTFATHLKEIPRYQLTNLLAAIELLEDKKGDE